MSDVWVPSDRQYMIDDLCRTITRVAANEGWFQQSWQGVDVWQLPEDLVRLQGVVHTIRPRWIIETGTKFGGSAIFFASLLALNGETAGGVITVDLDLKPQALDCFRHHPLGTRIKAALAGDAAAPDTLARCASLLASDPGCVMVFLDDDHNADHVERELQAYAPLVTPGSYLIVADTSFAELAGTPVGRSTPKYPDVARSNPKVALERFLVSHGHQFERVVPPCPHGPGNFKDGFLRRRTDVS